MILFRRITCAGIACLTLFGHSADVFAWGPDGHSAIGILAMAQLETDTHQKLEGLIGPLDEQAMVEACNWPDVVRETGEWAWSAPLHYVNIPREDDFYLESRDCPKNPQHPGHTGGLCVTEGIKHYAIELISENTDKAQRKQAFAWLCHLVGDIHQPLHSGFADDRGGNSVNIEFNGEQMNLHAFWDFKLINLHAQTHDELVRLLGSCPFEEEEKSWSHYVVDDWTNESHALAIKAVYREGMNTTEIFPLNETYASDGWIVAQQQVELAAFRLAWILNTIFRSFNLPDDDSPSEAGN